MNTTDAGPNDEARCSAWPSHAPPCSVAGGRAASNEEITEHTCDRFWLGAVPAPVERALVERQAKHALALAPRALVARLAASKRQRRS